MGSNTIYYVNGSYRCGRPGMGRSTIASNLPLIVRVLPGQLDHARRGTSLEFLLLIKKHGRPPDKTQLGGGTSKRVVDSGYPDRHHVQAGSRSTPTTASAHRRTLSYIRDNFGRMLVLRLAGRVTRSTILLSTWRSRRRLVDTDSRTRRPKWRAATSSAIGRTARRCTPSSHSSRAAVAGAADEQVRAESFSVRPPSKPAIRTVYAGICSTSTTVRGRVRR